jgi:hypothetical protein
VLLEGVVGTEESVYSRLLAQNLCAQTRISGWTDNADFYVEEIREWDMEPDCASLRMALSELVRESERAGRTTDALRFQKDLIFFAILEGTPNRDFGEPVEEWILRP